MNDSQYYISYSTDTTFASLAPLLVKSHVVSRAEASGTASSLVRSNDALSSWTGSACNTFELIMEMCTCASLSFLCSKF